MFNVVFFKFCSVPFEEFLVYRMYLLWPRYDNKGQSSRTPTVVAVTAPVRIKRFHVRLYDVIPNHVTLLHETYTLL